MMIEATRELVLGRGICDDCPITVGPAFGPMTVFGLPGSGKTVAARSLLEQLANNPDGKPVIAVDASFSPQGYGKIARDLGGLATSVSEPAFSFRDHDHLDHELSWTTTTVLSVRAKVLHYPITRDAASREPYFAVLRELLSYALSCYPEKTPHIILDQVDKLLEDEQISILLQRLWRQARYLDSLAIAVFHEAGTLCDDTLTEAGTRIVDLSQQILRMGYNRHEPKATLTNPLPRIVSGTRAKRVLPSGSGVYANLYEKPRVVDVPPDSLAQEERGWNQ